MRIRGALLFAYCLILLAGTWFIIDRNKLAPVDFIATRDLPANRLLRQGDVVSPASINRALHADDTDAKAFVGRYMRLAVPMGAPLRLWSTDSVPHIVPRAGFQTVTAVLSRAQSTGIDADSCVTLAALDARPVLVRAVLCPASEQAACAAVVEVASARLSVLTDKTAPLSVSAEAACP